MHNCTNLIEKCCKSTITDKNGITMSDQVPDKTHEKWQELILGVYIINFDFFPVKLLLARLKLQVKRDPSPQTIEKSVNELRELFVKNQHIPKAKDDLNKIFKRKFRLLRWFRR